MTINDPKISRLIRWKRKRLEREGVALFDLQGKMESKLFKDIVIRFQLRKHDSVVDLPFHRFVHGDMVLGYFLPVNLGGDSGPF